MAHYDIVIPARDEAPTVGAVVRAAVEARGVGTVYVIDDGSTDDTAEIARSAGATVLDSRGVGNKAEALATGVAASTSESLVFFDADIVGPQPIHFEALAAPVVEGRVMLSCGLVDYGRLRNPIFLRFPPITGLRALRREVFESIPHQRRRGFQIEIMVNEVVARGHLPCSIRILSGTRHRSKIEKIGWRAGLPAHVRMTLELLHCFTFVPLWTYGSYLEQLQILPGTSGIESVEFDVESENNLLTGT